MKRLNHLFIIKYCLHFPNPQSSIIEEKKNYYKELAHTHTKCIIFPLISENFKRCYLSSMKMKYESEKSLR